MHDDVMFGPRLLAGGETRFRLWAPSVSALSLRLDDRQPLAMHARGEGWFELDAQASAGSRYRFVLPDGLEVPDLASRMQDGDVHDASVVVDPQAYVWNDAGWRNRPWHEAVIYELHVGAFGGFAGVQAELGRLAALGVTAVELMPIADFPGRHNWGYDGVLPFAPDRAYGTPDELKALVDAAHALGVMVFLDVVYNHFGPDGAYPHVYAKSFFDEGVHTPWGAAIDFKRPEVASFFVQNALMWVNEFHIDGLRFDAVHAISPDSFLPDLARAIRAGARQEVHLVVEHEGNRSSILGGKDAGQFDAQWADDWHHCVHVLLTGESEGYYEDFQNPAEQLARAMSDGFVFQGEVSPHLNRKRGEASAHLPSTSFVVCLQNHDQVGNRAMGERLAALAHPEALDAAICLLLLSPTIPLLFMGEELGTTKPFLFFTDHNDELAEAVRVGRRREFAHFAAFADESRRAAIPDPNAHATFEQSVPAFPDAGDAGMPTLYKQLIAKRASFVVPGIEGCRSAGAEAIGAASAIGRWTMGNGTLLTLAVNFGTEAVRLPEMQGEEIHRSGTLAQAGLLGGRSFVACLAHMA